VRNSSATATIDIADSTAPSPYVGRFAPSPTGPLHLGSLATALASALEARARRGRWLIRIEDLDSSRRLPGMADQHLRTLEAYGFEWDGAVRVQSAHLDPHTEALERLRRLGLCYECTCSRAEISALRTETGDAGEEDLHYPGLCRSGPRHAGRARALRFLAEDREIAFDDRWQGHCVDNVARSVGDFIVRRRDGIPAYQLAVVVDDAAQGVTDVVRGCDLLASTPRQILLQEALGFARPGYAHLPLIVAADGTKLSKSSRAIGVAARDAGATLLLVLNLLGQAPPGELAGAPPAEVWTWAIAHWNAGPLRGRRSIRAPD